MKQLSALSIRQPYVEQILRGKKKIEYRSRATNKRGRVYLYASKTPAPQKAWNEIGLEAGTLPTGVIVGTVEVVGCRKVRGEYEWDLAKPNRLKRPLKPKNHPQPAWFYPF
jgi:predicted transcriptional regulator